MKCYSHGAGRTLHPAVSSAMLVLAPLLVACLAATAAMARTDAPTYPAAVVHAFNEAINRGDLQGTLALLAPSVGRWLVRSH